MDPVHGKTQTIRLLDVFFIGPLMLYAGHKLARERAPALGGTLAFLGALTVIYNGQNYLELRKP